MSESKTVVTTTTRGPLDPPADGERREDRADRWVGCCGIWWSRDAWMPPSAAIEIDATAAAAIYRVIPSERSRNENCPLCEKSFCRNDPDFVDARRVLGDPSDALPHEIAYQQRLRDTREGAWIRFGPMTIPPGANARLLFENNGADVIGVTHLSLPSDIATHLRVLSVVNFRDEIVSGPLPGEIFAVRIPRDARHPIDRGGSLGMRLLVYPHSYGGASVMLENKSAAPIEAIGALFGSKMDVAADACRAGERK